MSLRTTIFWIHLCAAMCVGVVIVLMSASGVLLAFERQITHWADVHDLEAGPVHAGQPRLHADTLAALASASMQATPTSLTLHTEPDAPVAVAFGRERVLLLNRYTGAVLDSGSTTARAFFRAVEDTHRWLALPGDGRRVGRAVTGAANLVFLLMVVTGAVLWWPRNRSPRALRAALLFRRGLRPRARDFNIHNVVGIWSALPLVVIIASGAVISYGWAGGVVDRVFGGDSASSQPPPEPADVATGEYLDLLQIAELRLAGWRSITVQLPPRNQRTTFIIDRGNGAQPHKRHELVLSGAGTELAWKSFGDEAPAERARSVLRFAHTGEVLGIMGQVIAALASAGVLFLAWTGGALALRRLRTWRARPPGAAGG